QERHPRAGPGLPGVPVLAGGPAHRRQELLPPAPSRARRAGGRGPLPQGTAGDHRRRLRFLGAGAEAALQRRRRVRPDPRRRPGRAVADPNPTKRSQAWSSVPNPLTPPEGGARASGRQRRVLPGVGLRLGYTLAWLGLIVLIPLAGVFVYASGLGWDGLWRIW